MELNRLEICNLLNDENNTKLLADKVRKLVVEKFSDRYSYFYYYFLFIKFLIYCYYYNHNNRINDGDLQLDQDHIVTILNWARNRINTLKDLVNKDLSFIWVLPPQVITLENSRK